MKPNESYVLITDSDADLSEQMLHGMGVPEIPLNVFMKDNPALPCTLRGEAFYNALREGQVACTSAANLSLFRETFGKVLESGRDVLYLSFSSPLSCMCATARIAADELQSEYPTRRIVIIDSLCASLGQGLLVYHCAEQKERGMSLDELAAYAEATRLKIMHWFTVDDLLFLKRGGRVGAMSAFAGALLGIKPVLHVSDEGKLVAKQKIRGRKHAVLELGRHYAAECTDFASTVFVAHADAPDAAEMLKEALIRDYGAKTVIIGEIGPVIGAHAGPGTVALFYLGSSREGTPA
ncbi:MAG: DegV family protein [Oscillospiraceae bacterium]|nr:DegV family protein [Oscillospiraceae bacterium]